jgi:hypothetical protein
VHKAFVVVVVVALSLSLSLSFAFAKFVSVTTVGYKKYEYAVKKMSASYAKMTIFSHQRFFFKPFFSRLIKIGKNY